MHIAHTAQLNAAIATLDQYWGTPLTPPKPRCVVCDAPADVWRETTPAEPYCARHYLEAIGVER